MAKMPLDIGAVIKEAIGVNKARQEPFSVSVYIDDSAPADLIAHVRSAFASSEAHARITMLYLGTAHAVADPNDDIAVVVAGVSEDVGRLAADLRLAGVPTMVVTTMPQLVGQMALTTGFPVPDGDIIAPASEDAEEPIMLDDAHTQDLDMRMGRWVCATTGEKRFSFAMAMPFVRRPLALDSVNKTAIENAGVGLIVFIPGADMPVMTLNQAKMVLQIAGAYGQPITTERVKELLAVVGGGFAARHVARQLVAIVPGIGFIIKAGIGYSATLAMGHAAIEYFENGGGIMGVGKTLGEAVEGVMKAVGTAVRQEPGKPNAFVAAAAASGNEWVKTASDVVTVVGRVAQPLMQQAAKTGAEALRDGLKAFAKK